MWTIFIFRWWYFESSEQFQEEASFAKASLCNTWAFGCKWDLRILFYLGRPQQIFLSFELWALSFYSQVCAKKKESNNKDWFTEVLYGMRPNEKNCNYWFFSLEQYSFVSHFVFWAMYLWIIHFEVTTDFVYIHTYKWCSLLDSYGIFFFGICRKVTSLL